MRNGLYDSRGRVTHVIDDGAVVYKVAPTTSPEWEDNPLKIVSPPPPIVDPHSRQPINAAPQRTPPLVTLCKKVVGLTEEEIEKRRREEGLRRLGGGKKESPFSVEENVRMTIDGIRSRPIL